VHIMTISWLFAVSMSVTYIKFMNLLNLDIQMVVILRGITSMYVNVTNNSGTRNAVLLYV